MRLIASALVTLAFAGMGSFAQAQTLKVTYDISLAGLLLGTADLSSSFNGSKYQMTGKAKLTFKRPSPVYPPLALTETLRIIALVSPDKPGTTDRLMLWISSPVVTTADEGAGAKLHVSEDSTGDEEGGEPKDDNGSIEALAREFKGQRWDADKSVWK